MVQINESFPLFERSRVVLFLYQGTAARNQATALADVGWFLARAGHRVLIADSSVETFSVPRRLSHFPTMDITSTWDASALPWTDLATLMDQDSDSHLTLRRVVLPGPAHEMAVLSWGTRAHDPPVSNPDPRTVRSKIDDQRYDYVLLACSPESAYRVLPISDVVLIAFSTSNAAITRAANLANSLLTAGYDRELAGLVLTPPAPDIATRQAPELAFRSVAQRLDRRWLGLTEVSPDWTAHHP